MASGAMVGGVLGLSCTAGAAVCSPVGVVAGGAVGGMVGSIGAETSILVDSALDIVSIWLADDGTKSPTSPGRMQQEVNQGKAPKTVDRVDKGRGPYEKDHVHFNDKNKSALNNDGTWKHGKKQLNRHEKKWIKRHNWALP